MEGPVMQQRQNGNVNVQTSNRTPFLLITRSGNPAHAEVLSTVLCWGEWTVGETGTPFRHADPLFSGTNWFGTNAVANPGLTDRFFAQYNEEDNLLWVAPGGSANDDSDNGIAVDPESIMAGTTPLPGYPVTFGSVSRVVSTADGWRLGAPVPSARERGQKVNPPFRSSGEVRPLTSDQLPDREKLRRIFFIVVVTMTVILLAMLFGGVLPASSLKTD
jgi:hypothetical protein